jgi:uracil phosphoribosyltransferase
MQQFENAFIFDHPLIQHKTSLLRDKNTSTKDFRELVSEISMLMAYEVTRDFELEDVEVETPICKCTTKVLSHKKKITLVPVLRAGLGMVDGMLRMVPSARVGHIGLYRDETTMKPVEYFCKLPKDIEKRDVFVVDPMLATGGSGIDAIAQIKQRNPKSIRFLCLIAAPEGIEALSKAHPDVHIYCAAQDEKLNENCYIVPGLGDAGDRIFGTK